MDYHGLSFEEDVRHENPPKNNRRGNFKAGWTKAVDGREFDSVLEDLTWENLGWRIGKMVGPASEAQKEEMFELLLGIYRDQST